LGGLTDFLGYVRSVGIINNEGGHASPVLAWTRCGLSTTLHRLGVPDKDIQQILRHANVNVTQESYIKTTTSDAMIAMRLLERIVNLPDISQEG